MKFLDRYCRHRRVVGNQHGEICMDCNTRLFGMDPAAILKPPEDGHQHIYIRAEAGYLICRIPGCDAYLKFGK